jgi:hypothetical protein
MMMRVPRGRRAGAGGKNSVGVGVSGEGVVAATASAFERQEVRRHAARA